MQVHLRLQLNSPPVPVASLLCTQKQSGQILDTQSTICDFCYEASGWNSQFLVVNYHPNVYLCHASNPDHVSCLFLPCHYFFLFHDHPSCLTCLGFNDLRSPPTLQVTKHYHHPSLPSGVGVDPHKPLSAQLPPRMEWTPCRSFV